MAQSALLTLTLALPSCPFPVSTVGESPARLQWQLPCSCPSWLHILTLLCVLTFCSRRVSVRGDGSAVWSDSPSLCIRNPLLGKSQVKPLTASLVWVCRILLKPTVMWGVKGVICSNTHTLLQNNYLATHTLLGGQNSSWTKRSFLWHLLSEERQLLRCQEWKHEKWMGKQIMQGGKMPFVPFAAQRLILPVGWEDIHMPRFLDPDTSPNRRPL